jgi:hypothetical protein
MPASERSRHPTELPVAFEDRVDRGLCLRSILRSLGSDMPVVAAGRGPRLEACAKQRPVDRHKCLRSRSRLPTEPLAPPGRPSGLVLPGSVVEVVEFEKFNSLAAARASYPRNE